MYEVCASGIAYVKAYMLDFVYARRKHDRSARSALPRLGRSHAPAPAELDCRPRDLRLLPGGDSAHEPAESVPASCVLTPGRHGGLAPRRKVGALPPANARRRGSRGDPARGAEAPAPDTRDAS